MKFARSGEAREKCFEEWGGRKGGKRTSVLVYLHGTEHGHVDAPCSYHAKAFMAAECRGALDQGDSLFASVDEVGI